MTQDNQNSPKGLKRYDPITTGHAGIGFEAEMSESSDGEYYLASDIDALLASLPAVPQGAAIRVPEAIEALQEVEDKIGGVVFAFVGDGTDRANKIRYLRAKTELALNLLGAGTLSKIETFAPTATCSHGYNRIICAECNAPAPSPALSGPKVEG